jgi:uncharacterized membrane protein YfcA
VLRYVILSLGAFLIGLTKAGFGGGAFMVVTPLLAMVLPPKIGLGLMLPLLLATDVMALVYYRGRWDHRNIAVLLPPALLGIALGGYLLQILSSELLVRLIGLLSLAFGSVQLYRIRLPLPTGEPRFRPWLGAILGFAAGVTSTLAHLGGVLTTIFLLPQRLGPARFVATATALFFFMNAAKLPAYFHQGLLPPEIWREAGTLLPALVVGVLFGFALNGRVSPRRFDVIVIVVVFATGLYLLARPAASPTHVDRHPLPLQPRRV